MFYHSNFISYRKINVTITRFGKLMSLPAVGMGDCLVRVVDNMGQERKMVLRDVLHVPEAGKRLLSVSSLRKEGYQFVFPVENSQCVAEPVVVNICSK